MKTKLLLLFIALLSPVLLYSEPVPAPPFVVEFFDRCAANNIRIGTWSIEGKITTHWGTCENKDGKFTIEMDGKRESFALPPEGSWVVKYYSASKTIEYVPSKKRELPHEVRQSSFSTPTAYYHMPSSVQTANERIEKARAQIDRIIGHNKIFNNLLDTIHETDDLVTYLEHDAATLKDLHEYVEQLISDLEVQMKKGRSGKELLVLIGLAGITAGAAYATYYSYSYWHCPANKEYYDIVAALKKLGAVQTGKRFTVSPALSQNQGPYLQRCMTKLDTLDATADKLLVRELFGAVATTFLGLVTSAGFCSWLFPMHKEKLMHLQVMRGTLLMALNNRK